MGNIDEFNLVDEPWIPVKHGSEIRQLSLSVLFREARDIDSLSCELPVIDMALLRMLAAIAIRAATCWHENRNDYDVTSYGAWRRLWESPEEFARTADEYLANHHAEFDLLDAEKPFMQAPRMEAANGQHKNVRSIILDFPDSNRGSQFFQRSAESARYLHYGEAARWLVACQAYDVAGIKTGMIGDPRVSSGKCPPQGTGWAGVIGGVYLEGQNLHETILLNAPLWDSPFSPADEMHDPDDLPAWERPAQTACDTGREPSGAVDIMTWQSRRIRLIPDDTKQVIRATLVTNGDRLSFVNRQGQEPMTAWRRNETLEKKERSPIPMYTPIGHMPSRSFWRGLTSLLPQIDAESEAPSFLSPGNITWVGYLMGSNARATLPDDYQMRLHATGISYGPKGAVIDDMIDDSLIVSPFLMSARGMHANRMVRECIDLTEQGVSALAWLGQSLMATVNGKTDDPTSHALGDEARRQAYLALDVQFATWLSTVTPNAPIDELRAQWLANAKKAIMGIGRNLVRGMPPAAYVGKECSIGRKTEYATAGSVESTFFWRMSQIFDMPEALDRTPQSQDMPQSEERTTS